MSQQQKPQAPQPAVSDDEKQKQKKKIVEILKKPPLNRLQSQLVQLQRATENIKFFKELNEKEKDDELHKQCCQYMMYEQHPKGHPVIVINTIGDKFYIILSGSCSVHIKKQQDDVTENPELIKVAVMPSGVSFGELALISNKPRMATIICEEDCEFLTLQKRPFDKILKNKNLLNSKLAYLESLAFLQEINKGYLRDIYSRSDFKTFSHKQTVFLEGEEADAMYVVTKGTFKAMKRFYIKETQENDLSQKHLEDKAIEQFRVKEKKSEFKVMQIMTFNQNEYFGEEELVEKKNNFGDKEPIEGTKRTYSVICESVEGELLRFRKQLFKAKVMGDVNGEKYMLEHIRQKKSMLKVKYSQVQEQVNKFWKFLKEDRQQLKNNIELEKESKKRQLQVDQYTDSNSFSNLEDVQTRPKYLKKGSLNIESHMFHNTMNADSNDDNKQFKFRNSLSISNKELLQSNLLLLLDMHQKNNQQQQSGGRRSSSTKNSNNQFSFNQRKSLAVDSSQQIKLAENLQKLIKNMLIEEKEHDKEHQNGAGKQKMGQNFFQKEVINTTFLTQNPSSAQHHGNTHNNSNFQEEKNQILKQLKEQQQKSLLAQSSENSPLKQVSELTLQQQQNLIYELFQNHPSQKELVKQGKKYSLPSYNDKAMETISNRDDKTINLMGLDNRDIPVSKYEIFKDIIKVDGQVEFKFTDEQKEDIMTKKQIQKQPYKNYLKENQEKNSKIFENLKKKATKHLKIDAAQAKEEQPLQIEQFAPSSITEFGNINGGQQQTLSQIPQYSQINSLVMDYVPPKSPQITTPYDSHRKLMPVNIVQIDSFRMQQKQLSPKSNVSSSNAKISVIKKNLFETVTQMNKNEQKIKKGLASLTNVDDQQLLHSKNKSHGEFNHPITVRSQAFMSFQHQDEVFGSRSHSYHNLASTSSQNGPGAPQVAGQKQRLQSMQSGIISPIEEECGTSKNIDYKDKEGDEQKNQTFRDKMNYRNSTPSLMYIQHENQSPDHKKNRMSLQKFLPNQPDNPEQRQEYYIGQVGNKNIQVYSNGDQIPDTNNNNNNTNNNNQKGVFVKEKLKLNSDLKEINARSAGSHRILRPSQNPSVIIPQNSNHNQSLNSKTHELSQNASTSSPIGLQKKSLSLKLINTNHFPKSNRSSQTKLGQNLNLIGLQNTSNEREKSVVKVYTPVHEEEKEDNTPIVGKNVPANNLLKTPIHSKFSYTNDFSAFSSKTFGYGGYLTTNMSSESPNNQRLMRKWTQESLVQTPLIPNAITAGRPSTGVGVNAKRPSSALNNKIKESGNQFFNSANANNFVKSSAIKKQKLAQTISSFNQMNNSPNLQTRKMVPTNQLQELKKYSLQSDQNPLQIVNGLNHSASFSNIQQPNQESIASFQFSQIKSNRSSINHFNFQQPLVDPSQNQESGSGSGLESLQQAQQGSKQEIYPNQNYKSLKVFDGFDDIQGQAKLPQKPPIQMNKRFSKGVNNANFSSNLSHR